MINWYMSDNVRLEFTYGYGVLNRFGLRNVTLSALLTVATALLLSLAMTKLWHLMLLWGLIVGIGTGLFSQFTQNFSGTQPTMDDVLAMALASLSLLGLSIYGPGIATGLASGAPQLGAGAAVGTGAHPMSPPLSLPRSRLFLANSSTTASPKTPRESMYCSV